MFAVKAAAAFRRLCVETMLVDLVALPTSQPPSGGCVLKLIRAQIITILGSAAFRRLCVETEQARMSGKILQQPPSGGCVLKHQKTDIDAAIGTAAFRRLCVETMISELESGETRTAAFRRLCVETFSYVALLPFAQQPPSGGCVLKLIPVHIVNKYGAAAFRRLCVETPLKKSCATSTRVSRLQAAVC